MAIQTELLFLSLAFISSFIKLCIKCWMCLLVVVLHNGKADTVRGDTMTQICVSVGYDCFVSFVAKVAFLLLIADLIDYCRCLCYNLFSFCYIC